MEMSQRPNREKKKIKSTTERQRESEPNFEYKMWNGDSVKVKTFTNEYWARFM